ncbi:MAG: hypothetical protein IR153_04790 [Flavobacterium sp.]|nr:hypothetical protein [Flavobacterium sp.]
MNDRAFDYFKSRTFVESMNESTVVSSVNNYYWFTMNQTRVATTTKNEIEYQEVPSVIIPAKTMKTFSEYLVTNSTYENCDLKKFPNKRQMKTISFDSSNSPYIFYNSISYFVDGQQHSMKNEFYVSEITNVPESEAFEQRKVDDCGKSKLVKVSNYARPDRFYIQYFGTR